MRSCERPRKRSASEALPSSISNRYCLSIRTHGSSCRRRASSSLRRVSSFSALINSSRAAVHSSRGTTLCSRVNLLFCTMAIPFSFLCFSFLSGLLLLGFPHGAHLGSGGTATIEDTGAVALEATHCDAFRHLESLEDFASF